MSKLLFNRIYFVSGSTTNQNISLSNPFEIYQDEYNSNDNPLLGTRINVDYSNIETNLGNLELAINLEILVIKEILFMKEKTP